MSWIHSLLLGLLFGVPCVCQETTTSFVNTHNCKSQSTALTCTIITPMQPTTEWMISRLPLVRSMCGAFEHEVCVVNWYGGKYVPTDPVETTGLYSIATIFQVGNRAEEHWKYLRDKLNTETKTYAKIVIKGKFIWISVCDLEKQLKSFAHSVDSVTFEVSDNNTLFSDYSFGASGVVNGNMQFPTQRLIVIRRSHAFALETLYHDTEILYERLDKRPLLVFFALEDTTSFYPLGPFIVPHLGSRYQKHGGSQANEVICFRSGDVRTCQSANRFQLDATDVKQ